MLRDILTGHERGILPMVALVALFLIFVFILARLWIGWRRGRSLDHVSHLPLEDDEGPGGRPRHDSDGEDRR